MPQLRLEVVTPERTVFVGEAESVIVPGIDGYIGFMSNHAPLVAGSAWGSCTLGRSTGRSGASP